MNIFRLSKLLYCLLFPLLTAGCGSVEKSLKRGDNALALGEYAEAAGQYKRAYTQAGPKDKYLRGHIAYKMGDAYRRYGNVARALGAFRNAARYGAPDSLTNYYLGEMCRISGDYKGAEVAYLAQLDSVPRHSASLRGLEAARGAITLRNRGSAYTAKEATFFSGSRSDYCPAYMGQEATQLYFTTTRPKVLGDVSGITGMKGGDIYFAKKDEKGHWKLAEPIEGDFNTTLDEGACSFTADGRTMYLTVCPIDPQYPRMAEIWKAERSEAKWSKPAKVKLTADTLSSYAHPAVSPDGRWLYFTSDMPGGMGGLDLWRASLDERHGLGAVENLGPTLNGEGDDCFPAFRPDGELYFASSSRSDGLGGLDIYRAREDTLTGEWQVVHLPAPINSYADDFGITFEGLHNRGYFSSSRTTGGRGWDKLFEFSYPEVLQTVKGWVYEQDGYELPEAVVYMIGSDGTNEKFGVLSDGSFEKPLKPGVRYLFFANSKGYLGVNNRLQADSAEVTRQYVLQFPLPSQSIPVLVRNVFYEFDAAALTPESCEALDRLIAMLNDNPHVTIELAAHCDYRGADDYNLRLSQRRAESVVKYLTDHGIAADRLTAKGYGEQSPKIVNKKLLESYPFLHEGDTLTLPYILNLPPDQQEICNALNRRTEFRFANYLRSL